MPDELNQKIEINQPLSVEIGPYSSYITLPNETCPTISSVSYNIDRAALDAISGTDANALDLDTCIDSILSKLNLTSLTGVSSETAPKEKDNENKKEKKEMMNRYEIRQEAERRAKAEQAEISRKKVDELAEIIKQEEELNEAKDICSRFTPKRIIYNDPVTIVFWKDGTKTIVRATKETVFNKYNAFTAALAKKILMSNSNVNRIVDHGEHAPMKF